MSFNIKYGLSMNELLGDLVSAREQSVCRGIGKAVRTDQTDIVLEGLEMSMEQLSSELHYSLYTTTTNPIVFSWGATVAELPRGPWNQEPLWQIVTETTEGT